jgi:hypothetical protein
VKNNALATGILWEMDGYSTCILNVLFADVIRLRNPSRMHFHRDTTVSSLSDHLSRWSSVRVSSPMQTDSILLIVEALPNICRKPVVYMLISS